MLTDMQMSEAFDSVLRIPPISDLDSLEQVVQDVDLFSNPKELRRAMSLLEQRGYGEEGKLNIGVKKLLTMIEMARQEPSEAAERLVTAISDFGF